MKQQARQKNRIEESDVILRATQETPRVSQLQLENIIRMARNAPETTREKRRSLLNLLATLGHEIFHIKLGRQSAPDFLLSTSLPEVLTLPIHRVIERDAEQTDGKNGGGREPGKLTGRVDQNARAERIHGWNVRKATLIKQFIWKNYLLNM